VAFATSTRVPMIASVSELPTVHGVYPSRTRSGVEE